MYYDKYLKYIFLLTAILLAIFLAIPDRKKELNQIIIKEGKIPDDMRPRINPDLKGTPLKHVGPPLRSAELISYEKKQAMIKGLMDSQISNNQRREINAALGFPDDLYLQLHQDNQKIIDRIGSAIEVAVGLKNQDGEAIIVYVTTPLELLEGSEK